MRILFFDDEQDRHRQFAQNFIGCIIDHVYNVDDAIRMIKNCEYDMWFLDHDIGYQIERTNESIDKDGTDLVKELAGIHWKNKPKHVIIHSLNPVGAGRMAFDLTKYGIAAQKFPFAWSKLWWNTERQSIERIVE
jgi:hypothetical protein